MLASRDEILSQRRGYAETFVTAVGADIADPRSSKARRRRVCYVGAGETNSAVNRGQNPRRAFDELILSVASDARDADDLARANIEIERPKPLESNRIPGNDAADREKGITYRPSVRFNQRRRDVVADHGVRERFNACRLRRCIGDDAAGTHHGNGVRALQHFFKFVADEKDRAPLRLQLPHKLEEFLDLQRREDSGRLIQDQDIRAAIKEAQDFENLPHMDRRGAHLHIPIDLNPRQPGKASRLHFRLAPVDEAVPRRPARGPGSGFRAASVAPPA